MADISQKIPLGASLMKAARDRALNHINLTGKGLPASIVKVAGAVMTIKFETDGSYTLPQVTIPVMSSIYSRHPYQPGDKGIVLPSDIMHGNMSGLGPTGPSRMARPANLSPLMFMPIGNANWPAVDPNKHFHQGPGGTVSQTMDGKHSVTTDATNGVTHKSDAKVTTDAPHHNVTGQQSVAGLLTAAGGLSSPGGSGGGGFSAPAGGGPVTAGGGLGVAAPLLLAYGYHQALTGDTITVAATEIVTLIDPSGSLAALTIALPAPANEQVQFVSFTQGVTTMTWTGAFAANAAPSSVPSTGGQYRFIWNVAQSKWFRL